MPVRTDKSGTLLKVAALSSALPPARSPLKQFVLLVVLCCGCSTEAARVEFTFTTPHADGNPFARDIWATVTTPSGADVRLPAFWTAADSFAVRLYPDEAGRYILSSIEEQVGDSLVQHSLQDVNVQSSRLRPPSNLHFVRVDSQDPFAFMRDDGSGFVPLGGNIPWLEQPDDSLEERLIPFYRTRLSQFAASGLNWARIWMVHWSRLNLDWLEEDLEQQPEPGWLDSGVAGNWDAILAMAEASGIYVQMVLQYHGQYSTETNPKWHINPWNAANPGGFLDDPADFFTSEKARELTKQKYRYIVARWGYSPAIMAWELFNEVHWVDAMRNDFDEEAVASWHTEMADYIRSIDAHDHLITTSTDDIRSPIYDSMDYLQPHVYPVNILPNMRYVDPAYWELRKPAFYGEFGDDHMPLSEEEKQSGVTIVPPIWAGIMGHLRIPPQTWFVDRLIATGRLETLTAVSRFLSDTRLAERDDMEPFSPLVESRAKIQLVITPGYVWKARTASVIEVPVDGSSPINHALVPGVLIADTLGRKRGFPEEVTFRTVFPRPDTVVVYTRLRERGVGGTSVQVALDDIVVDSHTWPGPDSTIEGRSAELVVVVPSGRHTFTIRNHGGPAWFYLDRIETGFEVPLVAAVGKRSADFLAVWVWNGEGVFAKLAGRAASATIEIQDLPPGLWKVMWWDTISGARTTSESVEHKGGTLSLATPEIERHAAVVLSRSDTPA